MFKELMHNGANHVCMHMRISKVKKSVGFAKFDNYFKFSFVRNPFVRMVDWYLWLWHEKQHGKKPNKVNDPGTFEDFIRDYRYVFKRSKNQAYSFIDNQIDELTLRGKEIDFIGKVENIQDDWKKICEIIQIEYRKLPFLKKIPPYNYKDFYTPETKDIVAKRFSKDLKRFDYDFD